MRIGEYAVEEVCGESCDDRDGQEPGDECGGIHSGLFLDERNQASLVVNRCSRCLFW
jgi:hypothetical protein